MITFFSLIIQIAPTVFPVKRLENNKNNIRPKFWLEKLEHHESARTGDQQAAKGDAALDASLLRPTPYYNQAILEDMVMTTQHSILMSAANAVPVFADCVLLVKVTLTNPHPTMQS